MIKGYFKFIETLDTKSMWGYYKYAFKGHYYKDTEAAKQRIRDVINRQNQQSWAKLFGEDNPEDIINLYDYIQTKRGIKIQPKIKEPVPRKQYTYNTNSDLIIKQKSLWSDIRGIEFGRSLSKLQYIKTNDKRIYGTEKTDIDNINAIITKLKEGEDLPPILLDYDYGILDGHHRWEAAKKLKIKQIPVIIYENPSES